MRQTANERWESGGCWVQKARQEGFALITALLLMLILTVLGVSAVTMTSMENRIAGVSKTTEAASMAVESCLGTGVNVIRRESRRARKSPPVGTRYCCTSSWSGAVGQAGGSRAGNHGRT